VYKIDVIIVSYAKDEYCKRLTYNCIESLFLSEENPNIFNVIIVESEPCVKWENYFATNVTTYDAPLPYGYHKFLNFGRKKGGSEWVALCNNDLQFTKKWFSEILKANEENPNIISFSPMCPMTQVMYGINSHSGIHIGYEIRKQLSGWCIVHKREIYDKIGDLDERFYHWFCDNDYAMTLYNKGLYHALVTDSIVIHHDKNIGKTTERVIETNDEMYRLTMGSHSIFQKKWKI
jgi:hypothetical protein